MDRSTLHFVGLFLGMCVFFAGVGVWFVTADQDWTYYFEEESDTAPRHFDGEFATYGELTPREREIVDRAIDGERFGFEDEAQVPPEMVGRNGTYYLFYSAMHYDWLNPMTFVPTLTAIGGAAIMAEAARRDVTGY